MSRAVEEWKVEGGSAVQCSSSSAAAAVGPRVEDAAGRTGGPASSAEWWRLWRGSTRLSRALGLCCSAAQSHISLSISGISWCSSAVTTLQIAPTFTPPLFDCSFSTPSCSVDLLRSTVQCCHHHHHHHHHYAMSVVRSTSSCVASMLCRCVRGASFVGAARLVGTRSLRSAAVRGRFLSSQSADSAAGSSRLPSAALSSSSDSPSAGAQRKDEDERRANIVRAAVPNACDDGDC